MSGHFLIGVISNEKKVINNIVNDLENTLSAIFVYNDGVSKYELNLSLYIGISNFPEQATHLSKLIKQAKKNIKTKVI